jgi:chemotaxis response regulator CheB
VSGDSITLDSRPVRHCHRNYRSPRRRPNRPPRSGPLRTLARLLLTGGGGEFRKFSAADVAIHRRNGSRPPIEARAAATVPEMGIMAQDIIVIGASAGGVEALIELTRWIPTNLPASLFVVLHVASHVKSGLAEILSRKWITARQDPSGR